MSVSWRPRATTTGVHSTLVRAPGRSSSSPIRKEPQTSGHRPRGIGYTRDGVTRGPSQVIGRSRDRLRSYRLSLPADDNTLNGSGDDWGAFLG